MYDERFKNITAHTVVNTHDVTEGRIVSCEIYGKMYDGRKVWIQIDLPEDCLFKAQYADDEGTIPIPDGAGYRWDGSVAREEEEYPGRDPMSWGGDQ